MKRTFPLIITFVSAVLMIIIYFVNQDYVMFGESYKITDFSNSIYDWVRIIGSFALLLGVLNLIVVHYMKMMRGGKEAIYSVILLATFVLIVIGGFMNDYDKPGSMYMWIFTNVYRPLSSTMFALLAFYVASAAFRAFRAKTKEATFLLISAFIVMLGRVPVGAMISEKIPIIANWIMAYPTSAAQSAIMMGACLGAVSVSLKIILGIERTYLGGEE